MKSNQLIIIAFILAVAYFLISGKISFSTTNVNENESESEDDETGSETPPPPPPTVTDQPEIFDTESGEGKKAIDAEIKRIYKNKDLMAELRLNSSVQTNLLQGAGINAEGKKRFKDVLREQMMFVDWNSVNFTNDPSVVTRLNAAKDYIEGWIPPSGEQRSKDANYLLSLVDFSTVAGMNFYLFADSDSELRSLYVDSNKVYGDTSGKYENEKRNYLKFSRDLKAVINNALNIIEVQKPLVYDMAILRLENKGWKFY